jgi:hypothetical protein
MRFESILYHLNRGKVGAEGLLEEQMAIEKGKNHLPVTQIDQENKSNAFPSISYENDFPEGGFFYLQKIRTFSLWEITS